MNPNLYRIDYGSWHYHIEGGDDDVAGEPHTRVGPQGNSRRPTSKRLRIGWQKEFHEKKLLNRFGATVGSLQVTCSRLGISLRRRDASGPGRPRTVRPPYLPSHPPIAGQRHTGTGFQITLTLECNGTRRTTELPLTTSAIGQLKLEAEMRNLSMGQLLAEVASMAIKKGMIEAILHEPTQERAAPLQPENS